MKVLVTGAAGFLGRHVVRRLTADGFDVTGFDQHAMDETPAIVGDLTDPESVMGAADGHEVICHVGAVGDVYLAAERPALAATVTVAGSANVAAAAAATGARVVYASTWEVYGRPAYEPIDEDHPCEPDHPYNITKLAGERLLLAADRLQGVPVLALRLGTAYGPGLRPNSVFRIFIDRARKGEPITIQGDGAQGRQFTHASDIANAFLMAAQSDLSGIAMNIVAPDSVSVRELAEKVVQRFPTELTFGEPRPGDVPPARVSAARAEELLGWQAVMPFDRGLDELISGVVGAG
ncbi:MAG: NAD-dependent epimerase/dehydratase family protein [Acidimicrobiia bacterium]